MNAAAADCASDTAYPDNASGGSGTANCVGTGSPATSITCDFPAAAGSGGFPIDIRQIRLTPAGLGSEVHTFGTDADGETFCSIITMDETAATWTITITGTTLADTITFDHATTGVGAFSLTSWDETQTIVEPTVDADDGDDIITLPQNNVGHACTVNGGDGVDSIDGSPLADTINGGDHGDIINAGPGDDTIDGGIGADEINGNDGADTIEGGADGDTIDGGDGNDDIYGDAGTDTIDGGDGDDRIDGGADRDEIDGEGGGDTICGGDSTDNNQIYGGDDTDVLWGGTRFSTMSNSDMFGGLPIGSPGDQCGGGGSSTGCESGLSFAPGFCL